MFRHVLLATLIAAAATVTVAGSPPGTGSSTDAAINTVPKNFVGVKGNTCDVILCLLALVTTGINIASVLKCISVISKEPIPMGEPSFIDFKIVNGEGLTKAGTIMNAELNWGKWQQHNKDVPSVNNIGFNQTEVAEFTAMQRENVLSGAEGSFEIHENGQKIAVVDFSVPLWGKNKILVLQTQKQFVCDYKGFTPTGSPTVEMICHKIG